MPDVEISREEAALVLNDYKTATEELEDIVKAAESLRTPPDAFGSGAEGKKSLDRAKRNGQNIIQYAKDTLAATKEREAAARARIHALFGADFDSKIDIDSVQPETVAERFE